MTIMSSGGIVMQRTTASQVPKGYGLKSLKEVSQLTGQSTETLNNWYNKKNDLYKVVILGCVTLKQIREKQNGD